MRFALCSGARSIGGKFYRLVRTPGIRKRHKMTPYQPAGLRCFPECRIRVTNPVERGLAGQRRQCTEGGPSVTVEATGQPGYTENSHPFRSFHQHLPCCFDAFRSGQMVFRERPSSSAAGSGPRSAVTNDRRPVHNGLCRHRLSSGSRCGCVISRELSPRPTAHLGSQGPR